MISDLTNSNPDIFLDKELEIRRQNKLPPFQRFISLILTGDDETKLEKEAFKFKISIEDAVGADRIFNTLMGDQVEPRRDFIDKNALSAANLDVW